MFVATHALTSPCSRDPRCVKEGRHRGRCRIQSKPIELGLTDLGSRIDELEAELARAQARCERLERERAAASQTLAQAVLVVRGFVKERLQTPRSTEFTANECRAELRRIVLNVLLDAKKEAVESTSVNEGDELSLELVEAHCRNPIAEYEERAETIAAQLLSHVASPARPAIVGAPRHGNSYDTMHTRPSFSPPQGAPGYSPCGTYAGGGVVAVVGPPRAWPSAQHFYHPPAAMWMVQQQLPHHPPPHVALHPALLPLTPHAQPAPWVPHEHGRAYDAHPGHV
ncbi:hypothetical protein KFE25_011867 [Diacronema lutheri]|uniref:Uncharacterized protein n=1 Tax=Diacronema lutheri TaxID=2081491 RepID=A0A8J5X417_DIALT|nr:hypothetical protein KFE25_011867 [Diacronema lutheri]